MALNCTGEILPKGIPTISISDNPISIDDFCNYINTDDEILLYEEISGSNRKYWVIIEADEYPISVCELEHYADYLSQEGRWDGRRSDYLVIGSNYFGKCYLVIIELRHVLVKANQEDDKIEQLSLCVEYLINNHIKTINESQALKKIYEDSDSYTIIGVIIAPGNTRSFSRGELNKVLHINSHKVLIRTLPKDALTNCKITWTDLIKRIGMPPNQSKR